MAGLMRVHTSTRPSRPPGANTRTDRHRRRCCQHHIFRGTDFGNAVTVQPGLTYSTDSFEIGAWSSWAIDGGGANEHDIYASFSVGPVGITVTDYFFPAGHRPTSSATATVMPFTSSRPPPP